MHAMHCVGVIDMLCAEFIGCSPSLSGALRVNPWSVDNIADSIYAAIKMPIAEQVHCPPKPPQIPKIYLNLCSSKLLRAQHPVST